MPIHLLAFYDNLSLSFLFPTPPLFLPFVPASGHSFEDHTIFFNALEIPSLYYQGITHYSAW